MLRFTHNQLLNAAGYYLDLLSEYYGQLYLQFIQAIQQLRGANTRKLEADSRVSDCYQSKKRAKRELEAV